MTPQSVVAAVDVGSNSAHLLVARLLDGAITALADESAFLGLGDRVRVQGYLGRETRTALVDALAGFFRTAEEHGATQLAFVGTSPIRRAADAPQVVRDVEDAIGVPLAVLSHEEEALLTLIGATAGVPPVVPTIVVDVGGGSSQIVAASPGRPPAATGVDLGSAVLTGRFVASDPPTSAEVQEMRAAARDRLGIVPGGAADTIVAVGGTASNVAKVVRGENAVIGRAALDRVVERLTTQPTGASAAEFLIRPQRARLLPAGIAIFEAILDRYGASELRVVEEGIREGLALAMARAGRRWRDRLRELARG